MKKKLFYLFICFFSLHSNLIFSAEISGEPKADQEIADLEEGALALKDYARGSERPRIVFTLINTKSHDYYQDFLADINTLIEYIKELKEQQSTLEQKELREKIAALQKVLKDFSTLQESFEDAREFGVTLPKWRDSRNKMFNEYLGIKEPEPITYDEGYVPEAP